MNIEVIPLVDLRQESKIDLSWPTAMGRFIGGKEVDQFENFWANYVGAQQAVGTGSGTDALTLILQALRRRPRSADFKFYVVVPGTSFVATLEAVLGAQLTPIVCDVTSEGLMSPKALEHIMDQYGREVLAVVPVHLYGQVCEVDDIVPNDIYIVEDACQAHGARYADGTRVGSRHPAAWSFMPAKILGAYGDAGAATFPAKYENLSKRVRRLGNHGRDSDGVHLHPGTNSRLDTLQAYVLNQRGFRTSRLADLRGRAAAYYLSHLASVPGLRLQSCLPEGRVWTYFTVWVEDLALRRKLINRMKEQYIEIGKHYPYSLASIFPGRVAAVSRSCPIADDLAQRTLSLPLWPGISIDQQNRVIQVVRETLA